MLHYNKKTKERPDDNWQTPFLGGADTGEG